MICEKCYGECEPTGVMIMTLPPLTQYKCKECGHLSARKEKVNDVSI